MNLSVLAATFQQGVAVVLVVLAIAAWVIYLIIENAGGKVTPKTNVDSFLGAPNRKAAPDDETFEGPRLDRFLSTALISMTFVAVALPVYWLGEPGRSEGAIRGFDKRAVAQGERLYTNEHAEEAKPAGLNCQNCHGLEKAGAAKFTINLYDADGKFTQKDGKPQLKRVQWSAPALAKVGLRYRPEQITAVLIYGRGSNKPMPAWGVAGGGPASPQMIDNLMLWIRHLPIEGNEAAEAKYLEVWKKDHDAKAAYDAALIVAGKEAKQKSTEELEAYLDSDAGRGKSEGEALFNLNCARCHTKGYSYGEPGVSGGGYYGPNLGGGASKRQFPSAAAQIEYVTNGVDEGKGYGTGGVQTFRGGGMPYFGNTLTDEQIKKIVEYERSLP
jgi:mono/diheme cytochrome c family protein